MPELPEVETVKNDLKEKIIGRKILGVEADWEGVVKEPSFSEFRQEVIGKEIKDVSRRAKNIIISLSKGKTLMIHLKLTGHLLLVDEGVALSGGRWETKEEDDPLRDPQNQFIRLVIRLSGSKLLALSDLRKFANIRFIETSQLTQLLKELGPEPLDKEFSFEVFRRALSGRKAPIKKVLMDQKVIAGIGNIYADEILFEAKIHPLRKTSELGVEELFQIYQTIAEVLTKAIELRGTSTSDYRDTSGNRGTYGDIRKVYRREGEPCPLCQRPIERLRLGGRSAHFCSNCQK